MILTIAVTIGINATFIVFAFKGYAPQQFQCRRCDHAFRRPPYRRMPAKCPRCKSTGWRL